MSAAQTSHLAPPGKRSETNPISLKARKDRQQRGLHWYAWKHWKEQKLLDLLVAAAKRHPRFCKFGVSYYLEDGLCSLLELPAQGVCLPLLVFCFSESTTKGFTFHETWVRIQLGPEAHWVTLGHSISVSLIHLAGLSNGKMGKEERLVGPSESMEESQDIKCNNNKIIIIIQPDLIRQDLSTASCFIGPVSWCL